MWNIKIKRNFFSDFGFLYIAHTTKPEEIISDRTLSYALYLKRALNIYYLNYTYIDFILNNDLFVNVIKPNTMASSILFNKFSDLFLTFNNLYKCLMIM